MFDQYRMYAGIAIGVALFAWQFWPSIGPLLAKLRTSATTAVTATPALPADDDTADFQALKRLRVRFDRLGCKEGKAALEVCQTHFFHAEG